MNGAFFAGFEKRAGFGLHAANLGASTGLGAVWGATRKPEEGDTRTRKQRAADSALVGAAGAVGSSIAAAPFDRAAMRSMDIMKRVNESAKAGRPLLKDAPLTALRSMKPAWKWMGAGLAGGIAGTYAGKKMVGAYRSEKKASFFDGFEKEAAGRFTRIQRQFVDPVVSRKLEQRRGMKKEAGSYYHRTSNLDPILQSGKILSLRSLASKEPEKKVSVEHERWERKRKKLPATNAYALMKDKKDVDHIFLTKDKPIKDDSYGKYIIKKDIKTPRFASNINMIPEEYKQKQPISVRRTTEIYAPAKELPKLQKKYPGYKFKDSSEIQDYHPSHSVGSFIKKVMATAGMKVASDIGSMAPSRMKKEIGSPAMLGGSTALGLGTPDSDVDIFVPYKRKSNFERAKQRLLERRPDLVASKYNKPGGDKFVMTSPKADVVLAYGENARRRAESVERAKQKLTPDEAAKIRADKQRIKNSWLFPETRYKRYKRDLDKRLGLYKW